MRVERSRLSNVKGGGVMADKQCGFRRGLKITMGTFLLAMGVGFFLLGFSIFPVLGIFFAVPLIGLAVFVFSAPRDSPCVHAG
jgi:hypothetical protein